MAEPTLLALFPRVGRVQPFTALGEFPTPVEELAQLAPGSERSGGPPIYVKRDDLSSAIYGGNKVRTLEALFGEARRRGCSHIYSVGAYGSNHALATVLHAERVGLTSGALLFPQPQSRTARDNLRVTLALGADVRALWHWSSVPLAMWRLRSKLGKGGLVMPPGGANPIGALGYVSAALEVAEQIRSGKLPRPGRVVVGIGSTCTTAGLLLGFALAARLGLGFVDAVGAWRRPELRAVRVSPWPVTSPVRVLSLALRTGELLAQLTGDERFRFSRAELAMGLQVDPGQLGYGYGRLTPTGLAAIQALMPWSERALDTTYSAKAAAGLLECQRHRPMTTLFWATKSSAPLPAVDDALLSQKSARAARWLAAGARAAQGQHPLA